ncbi:hydrolase [candidate division KSB1 bacterium]|nr:MAG: hydrolase [candidate division KSB1 bacterium]
MKGFVFNILLIGLFFGGLQANTMPPKKVCYAYRITGGSTPRIDGKLTDLCWQKVPYQDTFVQINPFENIPPTEKTHFKILYDNKNLYVGIMAYDSEPAKIERRLSRRDDVEKSDMLAVGLDSYFDHRTAFVFGVNAAGVKYDMIISEDGDREDNSWDPVWEVKTQVNDSGWVAEMRIPFSQIRFANKTQQTWGFQVLRQIFRKQEEDMWQYIPKDAAGLVSYFGLLKGIQGIKMPMRVELLPYTVSKLHTYPAEEGNPFASGRDFKLNAGLDGKIGLTSDLTADFTVNPDFGQVEADPSQVNLSAYETFFEEKRPFFIEGKNIFQFPLAMGDGDMAQEKIFYSRRIGRSPHYYPDSDDGFEADYIDMPEQARILGAAKISGKTQKGWSIGILNALTNREYAKLDNQGKRSKVEVEPLTNYFVSRLQKDFNQGNTSVGGIFTSTNRNIDKDYLNFLVRSAYSGGLDFRHQWDNKTYFFSAKVFGSFLQGDAPALRRVQESSAHYFQRPDAGYLHYDTTRTSLTGNGGTINIGRVGNGRWRFAVGGLWRSPGLELNDLGFLRNADQIMSYIWVGYRINNPVGIFKRVSLNTNVWNVRNYGGDNLGTGGNINGGATFMNYWGFYMGINRQQKGFSNALLRGGPLARTTGNWNLWFHGFTDQRKNNQLGFSGNVHLDDDRISKSYNISLGWSSKLNNCLNLSIRPFYNRSVENLQYVTTASVNGRDRYIFGRILRHTFGSVIRLNYSPTPVLSVQYYGQPFIATGQYNHFKRITNPRAYGSGRYAEFSPGQIKYDNENEIYEIDENRDGKTDYEFDIPDFNVKEFRSNFVVRWEYRPGSTLFLVWTQNRFGYESNGRFRLADDFKNLFSQTDIDNVFLIKLNYWFSM